MKHRYAHAFAQLAFNNEAVRRLDVFKVDPPERGLETRNDIDQFIRVGFVDFDVKYINTSKCLEQYTLTFHDGLGCQRTDIAQAQNGASVSDNADQVTPGRIAKRVLLVGNDFLARRRYTWRIGEG